MHMPKQSQRKQVVDKISGSSGGDDRTGILNEKCDACLCDALDGKLASVCNLELVVKGENTPYEKTQSTISVLDCEHVVDRLIHVI